MKIKDFLQNFVGQSTGTHIEVYDKHSFKTYQFHHVQEVIDRLGYKLVAKTHRFACGMKATYFLLGFYIE